MSRSVLDKYRGKEIPSDSREYCIARWLLQRRRPTIDENERTRIASLWYKDFYCFHYLNSQGIWEPYSYRKALENKEVNDRQDTLKAFRWAVYPQIKSFRDKELEDANNKDLKILAEHDPSEIHVDHVIPFIELVQKFCNEQSIELADIKVSKDKNNDRIVIFESKNICEKWKKFHESKAVLKVMTKQDNLTKKRTYSQKTRRKPR
ncbi:hypothetical protein [Moorena sp. SIO3A5]|uniref:hypothetical protein n=1 Tax=Moorena sp. SIO3A5 TaxID=2607822 RepID=UPI00141D418C|nr:hypothetical protein [Moorena sp. SIO3A5]NEP69001.1 hypothetical protein [Moorena sp. SIO3A5]